MEQTLSEHKFFNFKGFQHPKLLVCYSPEICKGMLCSTNRWNLRWKSAVRTALNGAGMSGRCCKKPSSCFHVMNQHFHWNFFANWFITVCHANSRHLLYAYFHSVKQKARFYSLNRISLFLVEKIGCVLFRTLCMTRMNHPDDDGKFLRQHQSSFAHFVYVQWFCAVKLLWEP